MKNQRRKMKNRNMKKEKEKGKGKGKGKKEAKPNARNWAAKGQPGGRARGMRRGAGAMQDVGTHPSSNAAWPIVPSHGCIGATLVRDLTLGNRRPARFYVDFLSLVSSFLRLFDLLAFEKARERESSAAGVALGARWGAYSLSPIRRLSQLARLAMVSPLWMHRIVPVVPISISPLRPPWLDAG